MIIRSLILPEHFVDCIKRETLRRRMGSWKLLSNFDGYGNPIETEIGEIYHTATEIEAESALLPQYFPPTVSTAVDDLFVEPGFIPYINYFDLILTFGISSDGAPFCFDYRDGDAPSVIWWDDVYWRRVAPNFTSFVELFDMTQ
ncbi:MAG: SMI1/KNR4 family protein [Prosthecobacter sp.]|nr:SMI1/KNR4 family protein [Prosthecobacter sp.]